MTKTFTIKSGQRPTEDQLREVAEAKKNPVVFDEDSPPMSQAMYKAFKSAVVQRNRRNAE